MTNRKLHIRYQLVVVACWKESMAEWPATCCSWWWSCCSFCCTSCCCRCWVLTWCSWQHSWSSSVVVDDGPPLPGTDAWPDTAASFTYTPTSQQWQIKT